jgi:FtsP/CotA-like multicopper oxidase with cupredoxin domain
MYAARQWLVASVAATLVAVTGTVVFGRYADAAAPASPSSAASQEQGMIAGQPLRDPANADADGLTITLDAAGTRFNVSGRQVWGQSYNGGFIAPTIHAKPGSRIYIRLVNHLSVATNLHFHGLHVSPTGDADDPFLCVAPGSTFTYALDIPANHSLGTYWYHSHAMGTTCAPAMAPMNAQMFMPGDVENQIFAGLSGALIIGDDRALLPTEMRDITTHTLVFKDVQIDATGHIVQNTATTSINSNNPTVRLINGQLRPVLTMRPGETQLWRLANVGADIFYQLQLDGYQFRVIGQDGVPVPQVTSESSLLLPPGKRYDVLVTAGRSGRVALRTLVYSNGPQGDGYPDTVLAHVRITGEPTEPLPPLTGAIPTAPADLANAPIAVHRTVELSEDSAGTSFYINGKQFMMGDGSVFATPAHVNTIEEWTITNLAGEDHPFHLHTNHFQVMSINGVPQPYTHVQDLVPVPHATNGVPGQVVIRVAFTDFPGKWMFHCHIAAHEDNGMMSYINVV